MVNGPCHQHRHRPDDAREIDLLARYFTGVSYSAGLNDATLPFWTITSPDLPSDASSVTVANVVDDKARFEKLWGLG